MGSIVWVWMFSPALLPCEHREKSAVVLFGGSAMAAV